MNVPEVVIERNRALEVAASDTFLTPAKARAMPDALLRAAAVMEGLG